MPFELSRFEEFLRFRGSECYITDYRHGAVPFETLDKIYKNWCFVLFESVERTKVFYFKGSRERFRIRCEQLLCTISAQYYRITQECPGLRVWTIGYVPALMTVDLSKDALANAIRNDFLKFGHKSYDTGENVLGEVCNKRNYFDVSAFKHGRYLDFDFSKWLLKKRKQTLQDLRKNTAFS